MGKIWCLIIFGFVLLACGIALYVASIGVQVLRFSQVF